MDLVVRSSRIPQPGETLLGGTFSTHPGGKGANQATALGRLGSPVRFLGRVGADDFGRELIDQLASSGVDVSTALTDHALASGIAMIVVAADGQNSIVVAPGANGAVSPAQVLATLEERMPKVALAQLEVPLDAIEAMAEALSPETVFILNPAPAAPLSDSLLSRVDILTPNETEAEALTGILPIDDETCRAAALRLLGRDVKAVVITLGGRGCWLQDAEGGHLIPAFRVNPVDTTAAGDAFNGGLAWRVFLGDSLAEACRWASAVGALATTREGAQEAMPTREEVEAFLTQ